MADVCLLLDCFCSHRRSLSPSFHELHSLCFQDMCLFHLISWWESLSLPFISPVSHYGRCVLFPLFFQTLKMGCYLSLTLSWQTGCNPYKGQTEGWCLCPSLHLQWDLRGSWLCCFLNFSTASWRGKTAEQSKGGLTAVKNLFSSGKAQAEWS